MTQAKSTWQVVQTIQEIRTKSFEFPSLKHLNANFLGIPSVAKWRHMLAVCDFTLYKWKWWDHSVISQKLVGVNLSRIRGGKSEIRVVQERFDGRYKWFLWVLPISTNHPKANRSSCQNLNNAKFSTNVLALAFRLWRQFSFLFVLFLQMKI